MQRLQRAAGGQLNPAASQCHGQGNRPLCLSVESELGFGVQGPLPSLSSSGVLLARLSALVTSWAFPALYAESLVRSEEPLTVACPAPPPAPTVPGTCLNSHHHGPGKDRGFSRGIFSVSAETLWDRTAWSTLERDDRYNAQNRTVPHPSEGTGEVTVPLPSAQAMSDMVSDRPGQVGSSGAQALKALQRRR